MDIKYLGHASFFIKSKDAKIVTDPFDPKMVGLKFLKTETDIVTVSHAHPDHTYLDGLSNIALTVDMPGEFEKSGVRINGYLSYHDKKNGAERGENILYKIEADGVKILHCGDIGVIPNDSFVEAVGEIDVLLVPTGGFFTIDANEAVSFIKKIEPSIVIPMHYAVDGMNEELKSKLAPVSDFLAKMGAVGLEPVSKLSIRHEDLHGGMKVVVMNVGV